MQMCLHEALMIYRHGNILKKSLGKKTSFFCPICTQQRNETRASLQQMSRELTWGPETSPRPGPPPAGGSACCRGTAGQTAAAALWSGSWGSRGPGRQTHTSRTRLWPSVALVSSPTTRCVHVHPLPCPSPRPGPSPAVGSRSTQHTMFSTLTHFSPLMCGCTRRVRLCFPPSPCPGSAA